jgi:hypothetical protein
MISSIIGGSSVALACRNPILPATLQSPQSCRPARTRSQVRKGGFALRSSTTIHRGHGPGVASLAASAEQDVVAKRAQAGKCSDYPAGLRKRGLSVGCAHRSPTINSEPGPEPLPRSIENLLLLILLANLSLGPTNFAAIKAASVRFRAQSARRSAAVWILLVPSAMLSSRAISLFDIPWASSGRISFCRRVNRRASKLKLTV